ncbi:protein kinase subdomain-containing protein PKL CAK Fmp29 [Cyathus striatus]|nr:protein kinase subdomain-containing protein PKL CAK Fmp29 [Cyathus striatus]
MPYLSARLVSQSLCRPRPPLCSFHFPHSSSVVIRTCCPLRRVFSNTGCHCNELFEYTSGRWIINDALRLEERKRVFNVGGLRRLAAESVGRSPDDIIDLKKLAFEGGFNRTFLITMRDSFQIVARIPYLATTPKYFAVASEVATMDLLRSCGLPIPKVYGYSPTPDNAMETEYILMDFVQGINLSSLWFDLEEQDIKTILCQVVELESKMMSIAFPAGGSLYYTNDLETGIPLEDKRFSVGPDVRIPMWFGRRSQLDVDRGPYESVVAALVKGADKELAYLEKFGRPLLPFQRIRREAYQYQEQLPSDHIENLNRYRLIAPSLVPQNLNLSHFRIRHPDLRSSNIIVDSNLRVISLIDWQHASILPMFVLAGSIPDRIQNYNDPISESMEHPSLPEDYDDLDESRQSQERGFYHRRLVHYHYLKNTMEYNKLHFSAITNTMLRCRLFFYASGLWEAEPLSLIDAMEKWEKLTQGGAPCPFDAEDVRETKKMDAKQTEMDELMEMIQNIIGVSQEGWVPVQNYEEAMVRNKEMKESALARAESEKDRADIATFWPWDDMDETEYL